MGPKGGRPTAAEQAEIVKKIMPYFEMGVSAQFTASLPHMPNEKTIQNYFRDWKEKYLETEAPNISERQMQAKGQFLAVFDKMLFNLSAQLNEIVGLKQRHVKDWEGDVEQAKKDKIKPPTYGANPFLENKFTSLCKLICEVASAKAAVEAAPYANERTYNAALSDMRKRYEATKNKTEWNR
jgi:hypothetical protein